MPPVSTPEASVRATVRILYFVSKVAPGIEAETEAEAEAIIQLEIIFFPQWRYCRCAI
jgi:hypothetical protein